MELNYSLTADDLLQYNLHYQRVSNVGRRQRLYSIAIMATVWMATAVAVGVLSESAEVLVIALVAAGVLALFAPRMYERRLRKSIKRHLADSRVQSGLGTRRLLVTNLGLRQTSADKETTTTWQSVSEIVRDGDHVYICLPGTEAYVIGRQSYQGPVPFDHLATELERLRAGAAAS